MAQKNSADYWDTYCKEAKEAKAECQHPVTSMFQYEQYDDDFNSWTVTITSCDDCGKRVY